MSADPHGENVDGRPRNLRQPKFPLIADDIVTLNEKVFFPLEDYPGYNFIGKLLGPKGSTLKALVLSTKTKISILGKGSSKDKTKEVELSKSDDPEHAHYKEPLHVLVQVRGPKITAHRRMSLALKELNYYMVPQRDERMDQHDERSPLMESDVRPVGRERRLPPPVVRVGIPPPGATIISGEPTRGESRRSLVDTRDPYAPDGYYEERRAVEYERYPEAREPQRYDREYRHPEKRSIPPSNGFSPKRYKDDPYNDPYAR